MVKTYLTIRDLADTLQVSVRTAYTLVHEPGFPAVKVRGQIRIPVSDLHQWVRSRATVSGGQRAAFQEA